MADDRTDIIILQEVKEDYEYVKGIISASKLAILPIPIGFFNVENNEDSNYSTNWSQALEMLNKHIKKNSPEAPSLTEEYIDDLMYTACFYNDLDLVVWLIKNGADVNFQAPKSGNTLLHLAALNGNVELAQLLIDNKAHLGYTLEDIITNIQGNTLLHLAAEHGHEEFIRFIAQRIAIECMSGGCVNSLFDYKNKEGNTLLHLVAKNGHIKCIKRLLPHHDKNKNKKSSLARVYCLRLFLITAAPLLAGSSMLYFFATLEKDLLLEQMKDGHHQLICLSVILVGTAFCFFIFKGIKREESLTEKTNNDQETALHLAIKNIQQENDQDQCVQLLIEAMPNSKINAQDKEGNTILHLAAKKGLEEYIKTLLEKKANAEIMTNNKETALHLAIENSHYNCAMCLAQGVQTKGERLRLKLLELSYIIRNKYDYHIKPYITDFKEKMQKKTQVKKSWQEEVLCLAIKHQSKGSSDNAKWLFKREVVGQLLKMVDESEINEVYSYAKGYSKRKDVKDGDYVLKKLNNFFCANEKCRNKNLFKLKKQESWCKDHILHTTSVLSAILALLFILKQNSYLSNSYYFSKFDNFLTVLVKVATILSVYFTIKLYLKHKELDNLTDCQDKIDEINSLLIKTKEVNTNSHIKV